MIELRNVTKIYKIGRSKVYALKNVSLKIKENEFVCIMGPSGSGKSTLLHLIGCLDKPTLGKVKLFGIDISRLDENQLAEIRKRKIGFIFQMYYLFPNLTAIENIEIPMILRGIPKSERRKRAYELLKLVGLEHRANHKPNELSGGEQQRVCIARALANDPKIILADEPTGSLDVESGKKVMEILKTLHSKGKTVVIVTHDPSIAKYSDRIVVLRNGEIVADDVSVEEALEILRK